MPAMFPRRALISLAIVSSCMFARAAVQSTFYVSPTGAGDYSQANPGSLTGIQAKVRTVNTTMTGDIVVYLKGGVYTLTNTMTFGPSDGGTNGFMVSYRNAPGEKPFVSGGKQVTGWAKGTGSIWSAPVPGVNKKIRNMFVNGVRANMAKGPNVWGQGGWGTYNGQFDGIKFPSSSPCANCTLPTKGSIGVLANPKYIEVRQVAHGGWAENTWSVRDVVTDAGFTVFKMQEPYFSMCCAENMWNGQPSFSESGVNQSPDWWEWNEGYTLYNAKEFLDTAGEFYYDVPATTLYYIPRSNETLSSSDVEVALVEGLVNVKGNGLTSRVQNMQFWGITFEYADWLMYRAVSGTDTSYGCAGPQSTALVTGIASGQHNTNTTTVPAAINIESAQNIDFEWNVVKHCGAVGVSLKNDASNCSLVGNLIYDMGGGAINVSIPTHTFIGDSTGTNGQEYGPTREGACKNVSIKNNLIFNTGNHFRSNAAIACYYGDGADISHNEVHNCTYSAISLGWGWGSDPTTTTAKNNKVNYNRLYDYMKDLADGGGIYTLDQQPGSQIVENYLYNINRGLLIYLDDGTTQLTVQHNVGVFDRSNPDLGMVTGNADLSANTVTNNETQDQSVIDSAGLQLCYRAIVNEPIAPQPGESPCASVGIAYGSSTAAKIAARMPATRGQVFDLRGRLLGDEKDLNRAATRAALGGRRLAAAGAVVLRRESDTGAHAAALFPFAK